MTTSNKNHTLEQLIINTERYCAYQERCSYDLYNKLLEWNVSTTNTEKILSHLTEINFLNDERFAKAYARGKFRIKKWGRIKIKQELKTRKISKEYIDLAIREIPPKEYTQAIRELILKKNNELKEKDLYQRKHKILRYLSSKGYELDLVHDELRILEK